MMEKNRIPPPPPPPAQQHLYPQTRYIVVNREDEAAMWVIVGFLLGFIGFFIAAVTDKGGGRAKYAALGCLPYLIGLVICLVLTFLPGVVLHSIF